MRFPNFNYGGKFSEDLFTFSRLPVTMTVVVLTLLSMYIFGNHPVCVASIIVDKASKTVVAIAICFAKSLLKSIRLKQSKIKGYQYLKSQLNAVSKF
jgi:hypothetical protein